MKCPNCNREVNKNDKYCMICGHLLWEEDVPSDTSSDTPSDTPSDPPKPPHKNHGLRWMIVGITILAGFILFELSLLFGDKRTDTSTENLANQENIEAEAVDENVSVQKDIKQEDTVMKNDEEEMSNEEDSLPESEADSEDIEDEDIGGKTPQIYVRMEESVESGTPKTQAVQGTQGPTTYNEILDSVYARYANGDTLIYVMYDIDKNGVQEMLVSEGSSDAACVWNVYTKVDGKVISTGTCPGAFSSLCAAPDGYLYMVNCNNNYEELYRTYLADNTLYVSLVETRTVNDKSEYYYPKGEYLTGKRITDRSLVNE